jgi:hypothetical protein
MATAVSPAAGAGTVLPDELLLSLLESVIRERA